MMFDCDTTVLGYNKFRLLMVEWLLSLIAFAAVSSTKGYASHSSLQYVVAIGVLIWLINMGLALMMLLGHREKIHSKLELGYYGIFTLLSFVAFICGAASPISSGAIKFATACLFFDTVLIGGSGYLSYKEMQENGPGSFSGILPGGGNPSMASQEGAYSSPPSY